MFGVKLSTACAKGIEAKETLLNKIFNEAIIHIEKEALETANLGLTHKSSCFESEDLNSILKLPAHVYSEYSACINKRVESYFKNARLKYHHCGITKKKKPKECVQLYTYIRWEAKETKRPTSNICLKCPICWETKPVNCLVPCGHMVCTNCDFTDKKCPICRTVVHHSQSLYES